VKIAKVKVPFKNEIDKVPKITDQYSFYCFFSKILENIYVSFVHKWDVL